MRRVSRLLGVFLTAMACHVGAAEILLTMESYGSIRIGMTVDEVHRELRKMGRRNLPNPANVASDGCDYYSPSDKLAFMANDRRIVRIETREQNVRTPSGLRIGDSASKVKTSFGVRLQDGQQHYSEDPNDRTMIVVSKDGKLAMRFEASAQIAEIYAGYEHSIHYVEGCS